MYLINNRDYSDPTINLALEEYCLRHLNPDHDYMLLFINEPAVVFGKHQNPFLEANVPFLLEKGIGLFRRISGGGAVYHDHGNLNFSYITAFGKGGLQRFRILLRPILFALNPLGVHPERMENNTIFIQGKKISGTAQYTDLKRMLSHGTLLFDSDLSTLNRALESKLDIFDSKGVASSRSRVTNISEHMTDSDAMDIHRFMEGVKAAAERFFNGLDEYELSDEVWDEILQLARGKYRSWEWTYGNTPKFSVRHELPNGTGESSIRLTVERGYIMKIELESDDSGDEVVSSLEKQLMGKPYDAIDLPPYSRNI